MKTLNVRELRNEIPRLRELLEREHELLLVSNGEPLARILPAAPRRKLESLAAFRAQMPMVETPSEVLVREDRDRRAS
jgi:prevent-host-death family protein